MRVGIEAEHTRFPNLAIMKLSAWHKSQGDSVEWYQPLCEYDKIYSSKVFTWTKQNDFLPPNAIKGGTGYGMTNALPEEVEHMMPDYSLYPDFTASLGFSTRGCIRACPWCIVPKKEGKIRAHAEIKEFLRPNCRDVVLMDNNILAHQHGLEQIEESIRLNLRIDCNQGLDARLISANPDIAKLLSQAHWIKSIRLACDRKEQMAPVENAVKMIREYGGKKYQFMSYVLIKDVDDALERIEFLRTLGVDPFAQPYRDFTSNTPPPEEQRHLARWCNHKAIFKTIPFSEYQKHYRR